MECPKCQHENPADNKFCEECGNPFLLACPGCGNDNRPGVKFCGKCGHDLSQPVAPEKTPAKASEPSAPTGERRQATVLFSDLSGYTAMNERLDPEEVEGIMSRIKAEAGKIVESHGGIVSQFVGDEVLALFGIPVAHEDDPRRAATAAQELHELAHDMSPEVEEKIGRPLRMHTGIHSGLIVTSLRDVRDGTVGVTGDTVNTGARLKALAEDDQILVSEETQRLIADYFQTEALTPVELKGKAARVTPYRVIEQTGVSSRFEASEQRGFTRYAGRETELGTLQAALKMSSAGQGQFVTVMGEPGIGKSRLLFEFSHGLPRDEVTVLIGHCQSYGTSTPYLPLIDALRRGLRLDEARGADALHDHAVAAVRAISPEIERFLPQYLHLLSIPSEVHKLPSSLQGVALRREFEEAFAAIVTENARRQPMVLILEDWHWADEASDSALRTLAGLVPHHPLQVVVTYRPEYERKWSNPENYMPLVLRPLGEAETEAMLRSVWNVEELHPGLAAQVHARTGGNALFNEEIARGLLENGKVNVDADQVTLSGDLARLNLPDSVHAVIRARVDRLDPESREVLRLASVIGREFTRPLLERLHANPAQLRKPLENLTHQDLIHPLRVVPEPAYLFKHALVQDVVYETLLLSQRKDLHARIGQAIEQLYAESLDEHFEALAQHYDQGEMWEKACEYHVNAGNKARKTFAISGAFSHFSRAMTIIQKERVQARLETLYRLHFDYARTLHDMGQLPAAVPEFRRAGEIARELGDTDLLSQTLLTGAVSATWGHMIDDARSMLTELEKLVIDRPDLLLGAISIKAEALIMWDAENTVDAALAEEKRLIELLPTAPDSPYWIYGSHILGIFSRWRGEYSKAVSILESGLQDTKVSADKTLYLETTFFYGLALGEQGDFQKALQILSEGRELGLKWGVRYDTPKLTNCIAWVYHQLAQYRTAIQYNQMALDSIQDLLGPGTSNLFEIEAQTRNNLGENHFAKGDLSEARTQFEKVYENAKKPEYYFVRTRWKPRCLLGLAEVAVAESRLDDAESYLDELREHGWTDRIPYKKYQLRARRIQGDIWSARGDFPRAVADYEWALAKAQEIGNPTEIWRTHAALGEAHLRFEQLPLAREHFQAAAKTIEKIADGLGDLNLKNGFIESEPVRHVFSYARMG